VAAIKSALSQNVILDPEDGIANMLQDINAMENSLLQANDDAMQMSSKIVRKLESNKR